MAANLSPTHMFTIESNKLLLAKISPFQNFLCLSENKQWTYLSLVHINQEKQKNLRDLFIYLDIISKGT